MTIWDYIGNVFSNNGNPNAAVDRRGFFKVAGKTTGLAALVAAAGCKKEPVESTEQKYDKPQGTGTAQGTDAGNSTPTLNPRATPKMEDGKEYTPPSAPRQDPIHPAQHAEIPTGDRLLIEGYLLGGKNLGDRYVITIQERDELGNVVKDALPALLILRNETYTTEDREVNPYRDTANAMAGFLADHNDEGCVNYARRCDKYSITAPTVVQVDEIGLEPGKPKMRVYQVIDAVVTMAGAKGDQGKATGIAEKWYEKGKKFLDDPRVKKVYEGGKALLEKGAKKVWKGMERGLDNILK